MTLSRRLQISMALMAALGALLLGLGQSSPAMSLLAAFAAVTSLVFTDVLAWFRLNRLLANLAALAAASYSVWSFFYSQSQDQLLSIANLLSMLLIILLYQEKSARLYWQIAVLSLLQVVVAAALNLGLLFGLLLVAYSLVAVCTLTLFYLEREMSRLIARQPDRGELVWNSTSKLAGVIRPAAIPMLLIGSLFLASGRMFQLLAGVFRAETWRRLRGQDPSAKKTGLRNASRPVAYQEVSKADLARSFTGRQLIGQTVAIGGTTLLFALILFYSVPRLSRSSWQGPPVAGGQRTSGFTPQVTLDQMGEILQNRDVVFRAEFFNENTREPYVVESPYFRGAVLVDYESDGDSAQWGQIYSTVIRGSRRMRPASRLPEVVRQEIVFGDSAITPDAGVEPPLLFSTFPIYSLADTPASLRYDGRTAQLFRAYSEEAAVSAQYRYALGTTAFRRGWPAAITPNFGPVLEGDSRERLTRFDPQRHGGLAEIAGRVVDRDGLRGQSARIKAQALASHFLDPGAATREAGISRAYEYSLRPAEALRTRELDPIEDFVVNHRLGHCEYFASALVMMLRSQGIPARMALGYKGGEFNTLGGYWQVRQLHAHAWVEVYLDPQDVPMEALATGESPEDGGWLLLDPTPAARDLDARSRTEGPLGALLDVIDYAQYLWNDYVIGLNSDTQKRTFYPPVEADAPGSLADLFSMMKWREFFASVSRALGIDPRAWLHGERFSWRAALATMVLSLVGVGVFRSVNWLFIRLWGNKRHRRVAERPRSAVHVEFYERLVQLLAERGIIRPQEQTQLEFAQIASERLPVPAASKATASPTKIVEFFYRVRFGGATLDKHETEKIEQTLTDLENL